MDGHCHRPAAGGAVRSTRSAPAYRQVCGPRNRRRVPETTAASGPDLSESGPGPVAARDGMPSLMPVERGVSRLGSGAVAECHHAGPSLMRRGHGVSELGTDTVAERDHAEFCSNLMDAA